jgi:hypothetical protein
MSRQLISDAKELSVGEKISFACNGRGRGGHYCVIATVTKVNNKTIKAVEAEGSYSPGTNWSISVTGDKPLYKESA